MVHTAVGLRASQRNRLQTLGVHLVDRPGRDEHGHRRGAGDDQPAAGAAAARATSSPRGGVDPVLQQLELRRRRRTSRSTTASGRSRGYWDRINRPEQLVAALPEAMRVLTDPGRDGRRHAGLPQDVQAEAFDYPRASCSSARVWRIARAARPTRPRWPRPRRCIRAARAPADRRRRRRASTATPPTRCARFADATGIPVAETQAGKGAMPYDHPQRSARSASPAPAAQPVARDADLVIGVGTRSATSPPPRRPRSRTRRPLRQLSTWRRSTPPSTARCRWSATPAPALEELAGALAGYRVDAAARDERRPRAQPRVGRRGRAALRAADDGRRPPRREVIGAVTTPPARATWWSARPGSMPGDLHKLWRTRDPKRLPRRVRLLVHGLRGRRRPRREARRARPRGLRAWSATAPG